MISLEMVTLITLVIGILLVGITFLIIQKNQNGITETLDETVFDKYNDELNDTAIAIYDELNTKYQEMLVVYELVDKKMHEFQSQPRAQKQSSTTEKVENNEKVEPHAKYEIKNKNYATLKMQAINSSYINKNVKKAPTQTQDNVAMKVLSTELEQEINSSYSPSNSKQEDVRILLKKGFSPESIGKDLGIGIGEVKFIAELLKVKHE